MVIGALCASLMLVRAIPPAEREHPAAACMRAWNCVGPMEFYDVPPGPVYALYLCDHGYVFLRQPDPEA